MGRKTAIIEAATKLFAEKGYAETSTAEIAENAGVAHGTIFYHFKNKEGIIREIFSRAGTVYVAELRRTLARQAAGIDKIEAALRFNEDYARHHARQILIFLRTFPDQLKDTQGPGRQLIAEIQQQVIGMIRDSLAAGVKDGTIACRDIEQTAWVINSLIFGLTHMNLMVPADTPPLTKSAVTFIRRALAPAG